MSVRGQPLMNNPEEWKKWEGRVDGKFPLRHWLGGSEHSAVFLTERTGQPDQKFAIKLIAADAQAERRLSQWRTAAQLSHPHLMRIYEAGRCRLDGTPLLYLVMEYAEEDLSQILPQRPLAAAEVTELLPALLDALSYLHGKGFVHGRVKPSNVHAMGDQYSSSRQIRLRLLHSRARWPSGATFTTRPKPLPGSFRPRATSGPSASRWSPRSRKTYRFRVKAQGAIPIRQLLFRNPSAALRASVCISTLSDAARSRRFKHDCSLRHARCLPSLKRVQHRDARLKRGPIVAALVVAAALIGLVVFFSRGKSVPAPAATTTEQSTPQTTAQSGPAPAAEPAPSQAAKPPSSEPVQAPKKATSRGDVLHQVLPDVSESARRTINGTVKVGVRVEVDSSGKVTAAKLASGGPSKYFAGLALKAAQSWEFSPPEVDGQATASAWVIQFRFKRTSTLATPERVKH